jgi:hyperosmotically inducible protein
MLVLGTLLAAALGGRSSTVRADEAAPREQTVADDVITTNIQGQYLATTELRHVNVSVTTRNGVVTLTGTVPSSDLRRQAADMARHTGGVVRVDDQMRVIGSTPGDPEVPLR